MYVYIYIYVYTSAGPFWPSGLGDPEPALPVLVEADSHDCNDPAGGPSA